MNVKTLICNARGMDPFRYSDTNSPEIETELDVADDMVRSQICAEDGNQVLQDVLRSAESDSDTYVMVTACPQEKQLKLFDKALRRTDFEKDRSVILDVRRSASEGILGRICVRLNELSEFYPRN